MIALPPNRQEGSPLQSPNVGYFISAALGMAALVIFMRLPSRTPA